jgi:hypothetical protein
MPRRKAPGTVPFSLDISLEAKLRFAGLHDALGFRTKAETFEAIVYAVHQGQNRSRTGGTHRAETRSLP